METKTWVVLDRDGDLIEKGLESREAALEVAQRKISGGSQYSPFTVYEAVAIVRTALQPVTIVALS